MDEIFWTNVVKRWSEASENVIKLKDELARVREERSIHGDTLSPESEETRRFQRSKSEGRIRAQSFTPRQGSETLPRATRRSNDLKDAEDGFDRAKEEYKKLQQELNASNEKIKTLTKENERLALLQQEVVQLRRENEGIHRLQRELQILQNNNHSLSDKIRQLEQTSACRVSSHSSQPSTSSLTHLSTLHDEIRELKKTLEERDAENEELREEMDILAERLEKAEETKKVMRASIIELRDLARQSIALRPLSVNVLQTKSGRSSRASGKPPSVLSSVHLHPDDTQPRKVSQSTTHSKSSHLRIAEDITVVEQDPPVAFAPVPEFPGMTHLRWVPIKDLPSIFLNHKYKESTNFFNRDFLKVALVEGKGDDKHVSISASSGKQSSSSYLCPTLSHHPWCPSIPGQPGYIFVGLGKEKDSYRTSVVRNLFTGLHKPPKGERQFRYLGSYRVERVEPLSQTEWSLLPIETKTMYAKHTKEKTKDPRTPEDILLAYEKGELLVPCVQLQCLDFDYDFYFNLLSQRDGY